MHPPFNVLPSSTRFAFALGMLWAAASGAQSESTGTRLWLVEDVNAPQVKRAVLYSTAAKTQVSYFIYRPEIYDADQGRRFPVLYWLHGTGGGRSGVRPLAEHFDRAIREEKIPPMLVVFANGLSASMWCDSADGSVPMETIVIRELVPHIDANYRTIPGREGRLLEGFSMGGYGAARLGFSHHDVFGTVSILGAGPMDLHFAGPRATTNPAERERILRDVYGGEMKNFEARSPWRIAEQHAERLRSGLHVRLAIGERDFTLPANRKFHTHLEELRIPHEFSVAPEAKHNPLELFLAMGEPNWQFYRRVFGHLAR